MDATIAFSLSPGWWIVVGVFVVVLFALAYGSFSAGGSGITPRRYTRPGSATPAPGARGPGNVSGRTDHRAGWETTARSREAERNRAERRAAREAARNG